MSDNFYDELNELHGSIFDMAMEGHTIDPKLRDKLPDSSFGIVYEEEDGKMKRSYPLVVPGNKQATNELVTKAVQMFHYCKPEHKAELAKSLVRVIQENKIAIEISEASQLLRFVNKSDLPKTVTIVPRKPKK